MSRLLGKLKARREELELEAEDRMAPTGLDTKALAAARKENRCSK